jgi:hypothetical protein
LSSLLLVQAAAWFGQALSSLLRPLHAATMQLCSFG